MGSILQKVGFFFCHWQSHKQYILSFTVLVLPRWICLRCKSQLDNTRCVIFFECVSAVHRFIPQSIQYRVPDFLAGRLNWLPPLPSPQANVSPQDPNERGAHILAWGEGGWGANWDEGIGLGTMVFYLLIPSLCFVLSTALVCTLLCHIQY